MNEVTVLVIATREGRGMVPKECVVRVTEDWLLRHVLHDGKTLSQPGIRQLIEQRVFPPGADLMLAYRLVPALP